MSYSGALRGQYIESGGLPVDLVEARSLLDPTPAMLSLFTDIDRLQWAVITDWGNPPVFVNCEVSDGGHTGSSGSFATASNVIGMTIEAPPRVSHAAVCAVASGAISVKVQSSVDTTGILITNVSGAGAGSFDDPQAAAMNWATGVSAVNPLPLEARALALRSNTNTARTETIGLTITITRTDLSTADTGFGGVLWGLGFQWVRPPLNTFKPGADTADSASV
tara:strand:+ start:17386 stop:18051 length:666 start_codon:yes stop_codon:yes gene_type:complete